MDNSTRIKDIMTKEVVCVSPNDLMSTVFEIFNNNNFHHLPVVEDNQLVGIISQVDVLGVMKCSNLFKGDENRKDNENLLKSLVAREVMTAKPETLSPDDTLAQVAQLFIQNEYHCIPIVDHGKVVGILTTLDLVKLHFGSKRDVTF
jgi:acetoin utilization protein AcuB